jgi:aminoglycoside phosphotransferase (APT) family kinase protein
VGADPNALRDFAVRSYVADVTGCAPDEVAAVTRFEDGNRHEVYRVSFLDASGVAEDLVVRVSLGDDGYERSQAEREARVLEKLEGVAAPQLRDVRLSSPWFTTPVLAMQFVPGRSFELSAATSAETERLGSVVAALHALPVDDLADWSTGPGTIRSYAESRLKHVLHELPWARDPLPVLLRDRLKHAGDVIRSGWDAQRDDESFRTTDTLALLHGDIAFGNVLWVPDPVLIDWEYARLGDPSDEIAYLFDQNSLDTVHREAFWCGYRTRVSSELSLASVIERVGWWEGLTLLGSTLWWVERFVRRTEFRAAGTIDPNVPKDPDHYLDQAVRRLDRLDHRLDEG